MLRPAQLAAAMIGIVLALSPVSAAHAAQADAMHTAELGCYEFNEAARVPVGNLRAAVPDRYTVRTSGLDPTVGFVVFVDYACDSVTVNGFTWPNRTVVTMGVTVLSARDGVPGFAYYVLWHATNNPHLTNALRKLGASSHTILATDDVVPVDAVHSNIEMRYRGAQLDHERDAMVVEPPEGPITDSPSSRFYAQGERGELLLTYANRLRPSSTARTGLSISSSSFLAELGIPATLASNIGFVRGEWDGTAVLQS